MSASCSKNKTFWGIFQNCEIPELISVDLTSDIPHIGLNIGTLIAERKKSPRLRD